MLVVETERVKVRFSFRHQTAETEEFAPHTECFLEVTPKGKEPMIYHGYSQCHWLDQFNKDTGRKIALARALHEAFPSEADDMDISSDEATWNYLMRQMVWWRYWNRHMSNKVFEEAAKAEMVNG